MKRFYTERRLMRWLENGWTRVERLVNRLAGSSFNPTYHLGTLSISLLLILTVTGIYLTIFYRPGADRAFETVAGISGSWLGSLMRTSHRYASDALVLVILLHALKMLLGDRFWGSRWLAWVSGWGLLALIWVIGVMGYWLVWDQQAQWLTEYIAGLLGGPAALAFVSPDLASRTFSFFVIVLFLHIFLSVLIVLGVLIHELRLSRARYWAPRWLLAEAVVAVMLLALWQPLPNGEPADLSHLIGPVTVDGWYLGFLPLIERWGNPLVWGILALLLVLLVCLPWLAKGRHLGPAVVTEPMCSGCALCFQECPFEAIEMRPRSDGDPRFDREAVIEASLCTGCGLCVGTCSTAGVELAGLPSSLVWQRVRASLARARSTGESPVVVFTCQRHVALNTLPIAEHIQLEGIRSHSPPVPAAPFTVTPWLTTASWSGGNPHPRTVPLLICPLPCVGMVQPEWVRQSMAHGAGAAVVVSCPADDCPFREGPRWLALRLGRHRSFLQRGRVHWLEVAPGDRNAVEALLQRVEDGKEGLEGGVGKGKNGTERMEPGYHAPAYILQAPFRSLAAGLAVLALAFGLSLVAQRPVSATPTHQGLIRVALTHTGQLKAAARVAPELKDKLPEGISPEQVLGGERFPVRLRLEVDGEIAVERIYRPGGLRREGQVHGLESLSLAPGSHEIRLWLMDDETTWQEVFAGPVQVEAGRVHTLLYDEQRAAFTLH